jgi:hypothetical protein
MGPIWCILINPYKMPLKITRHGAWDVYELCANLAQYLKETEDRASVAEINDFFRRITAGIAKARKGPQAGKGKGKGKRMSKAEASLARRKRECHRKVIIDGPSRQYQGCVRSNGADALSVDDLVACMQGGPRCVQRKFTSSKKNDNQIPDPMNLTTLGKDGQDMGMLKDYESWPLGHTSHAKSIRDDAYLQILERYLFGKSIKRDEELDEPAKRKLNALLSRTPNYKTRPNPKEWQRVQASNIINGWDTLRKEFEDSLSDESDDMAMESSDNDE